MQKQEQISFEEVIENNKSRIYRICKIYAISPLEPQDLFQEVVFQIWKSMDSFQGKSHVDTWIYRIALNVCSKARLKSDKKEKLEVSLSSIEIIPVTKTDDEGMKAKFEALYECMNLLKEIDQSILVLFLEEQPYKEIASILGLSENHVAVKMKRIRATLFECIKPKIK
jgi:RNA polymerase sigma-70 factor (ECF subfamily)